MSHILMFSKDLMVKYNNDVNLVDDLIRRKARDHDIYIIYIIYIYIYLFIYKYFNIYQEVYIYRERHAYICTDIYKYLYPIYMIYDIERESS